MANTSQRIVEYLKHYGPAHALEVQDARVVVIDPYLKFKAPTSFAPDELQAAVKNGSLVKLSGSMGSEREVYGLQE